jgi:prepilin-type processing-associated H-X9-DG protein
MTSRAAKLGRLAAAETRAFTLVELFIVVAIIILLAGLLLPTLFRAKAQAQSTACKNHLRQIGLGMHMYISDSGRYPAEWGRGAGGYLAWADRVAENARHRWTNNSWQCPSYVAKQGLVGVVEHRRDVEIYTSYAYNEWGMVDVSRSQRLGLGMLQGSAVLDSQIAAPSEMFTIADSRTWRNSVGPYGTVEPLHGLMQMQPFSAYHDETDPLHGKGYNVLFADGHVGLVKRKDYLNPPRAARHWNRDNQAHPELWRAAGEWAEQN